MNINQELKLEELSCSSRASLKIQDEYDDDEEEQRFKDEPVKDIESPEISVCRPRTAAREKKSVAST